MPQRLRNVFAELGISQYLAAFVDQGFDSWATILDITESDLDALGVKLGHRRKLQRRIATDRGIGTEVSLALAQPNHDDARLAESRRSESASRTEVRDGAPAVVAKRKYRRHPKPDENAPERPPSAYVLFSNKMRDELKGRNLSFTEIAKLVGENWQSLSHAEKEPFESQAQAMKDKYQADVAEYKKTPEYRKYMQYLQEFKAKHGPSQDKDASKRVKLESGSTRRSASNSGVGRTSRAGSATGSQRASEPPPAQQQRIEPAVGVQESPASTAATPASYHTSPVDSMHSPPNPAGPHANDRSPAFNNTSPGDPPLPLRRGPGWMADQHVDQSRGQRHLPSLSDVFETNGFAFPGDHPSNSPGPVPGLLGSDGRPPPTLRKQDSSASGSVCSSASSYPRTPGEGPLAIHSLLSSKPHHHFDSSQQSYFTGAPLGPEHKPAQPHAQQAPNGTGLPLANGFQIPPMMHHPHAPMMVPQHATYGYGAPPTTTPPPPPRTGKSDPNFDGMSALLKAGEIVDRRPK